MAERHPDLFSDSRKVAEVSLAKPVFEHHLETLTSRNEEAAFEHFCRALAEKKICPNLRAQSGPMGGGDGKVDGDTYPVAKTVSERWWVGSPEAEEKWAFAFSAMKKWQEKARKDVEKIVATKRGYTHIYFITNQAAKASTRAALEAKLAEDWGVPVTILDRAWIVQQVYDQGMLPLAIEKLNIAGVSAQVQVNGPRDVERIQELDELDKRVADPSNYGGARYQLVEDILTSALLARGLERPDSEVKARFEQAKTIADSVGDNFQIMRVAYNQAWTAYWWYEDFKAFSDHYIEVEAKALKSTESDQIEKLVTLWQLLVTAHRYSDVSADGLEDRTQRLKAHLKEIAAVSGRPNNALQAETSLALMDLFEAQAAGDALGVETTWPTFEAILDRSALLGSYPVERLFDLSHELGKVFDSNAFDAFFEKLIAVMRTRRSEGEAGQAYIDRGWQKLQHHKPYDAIRMFGRAEALLVKDEYKGELITALAGGSIAYQQVGLLWAARNKILAAAERCFSVFKSEGQVILPALSCLKRLAWLELALGRLPHVILALVMAAQARGHLNLDADDNERLDEEARQQDVVLGILLMRVPLSELPELSKLPATLDRIGLPMSEIALLHALGYDKKLWSEGYIPEDETAEGAKTFFDAWRAQPAAAEVAKVPTLVGTRPNKLRSIILGCELIVTCPSDPLALSIAESFLGGLEAFLATSDENDVFPFRETMEVTMVIGEESQAVPTMSFPETAAQPVILTYPPQMTFDEPFQIGEYYDWLQTAIVDALIRMVRISDHKAWLDKIAGQERGFDRAIMLGNISTISHNLFGDPGSVLLTDWIDPEAQDFPLKRSDAFSDAAPVKPKRKQPTFGKGPPPTGFPNYDTIKHSDRRVMSPIDVELWDKAGWTGVGYASFVDPDGARRVPPVMSLLFKNPEVGRAIFEGWINRYGKDEVGEALRIALVTGLSTAHPSWYAIAIGPDIKTVSESDGRTFLWVSRIHRMEPTSNANLNRFLNELKEFGGFYLAPAGVNADLTEPEIFLDLAFPKEILEVREAWEIGENDPDGSVLHDDDDPIIPPGVTDPPVKAAQERLRALRAKRTRDD